MNSILLRLLGLPTEESASVTETSIQLAPLVSSTIIIVIASLLGFLSWLAYRSTPEDVPSSRRKIMMIMRAAFFVMLLGLLLRPVIQLNLEREHKRTLAVLIDSSASMSIADPRKSVADRAREAITNGKLEPDAGIENAADSAPVTPTTRSTIAAQALNSEKINLMENLANKAELVKYSFAGKLGDSKSAEDPQLPETSIGNAMHEVLRRHSADDLGGIFLVTDGAHNEGRAPSAVAESLRERGIKVFTYGVGTTDPRDISVGNIDFPSVALAEDAIPVTVKLNHRGMNGEKAKLIVTLAGVKAGEKEITLNSEGEQEITIPIVPGKPNNYEIEARIETSGGEIL
ncbi:MAG: vWA domain-containing protein, partial [Verrucomicrobiota bacterium]|nr:vWA domain-containing protein [Verrucomicrobiota bacterium]